MHKIEMTVARAAVQLVGPEPGSHEFLEKIELFVGAAGCDQARNCVGSVLALDVEEPITHLMNGSQRGVFEELIALAKEWLLQTCVTIDLFEPKAPSHTDPAMPLGRVSSGAPLALPGQWRCT